MQFSHPEVLYALFLLIIPLLVHLFQLRKFRKESFTNVKFLKRLTNQTRKSSRLKKWLVLTTRMLLLAAIIIAFAQPYFPNETIADAGDLETVIYLDNSYSMQAQGQRGRLLERSIQELLEGFPEDGNITLITNTEEFSPVSGKDLQEIEYVATQLDLKTVVLRANSRFSKNPGKTKNLFLISDFQERFYNTSTEIPSNLNLYALPLRPERLENARIDTAYISRSTAGNQILYTQIGYTGSNSLNIPVSLYNGGELLGKSGVEISGGETQLLEFPLEEQNILNGEIRIEDNGLPFDNSLYFSINNLEAIKVVSINAAPDNFLNRIYNQPEFDYQAMEPGSVDYNLLSASQVIILNQLEELPPSLLNNLQEKVQESVFIIIPSPNEITNNFQIFLRELGFSELGNRQEKEKLITEISFEHPLFSEVFEERTRNFEYPKVQISYGLSPGTAPVLAYQDQNPFLIESNGNFLFTAPLSNDYSNFFLSPLVVPTFYNMGISALRPPGLYYSLDQINRIEIPVSLQDDNILQIASNDFTFIPQQQSSASKVTIILDELPEKPGNYRVLKDGESILGISFNVPSTESDLSYREISDRENIKPVDNIPAFLTASGFNTEEGTLWKWFVIFALILLFIETLLLKYLK